MNRTVNVVVSFTDADATPTPMSTQYNVSTYGYKSPDSPFRFAPSRLKSSVTFTKSIGVLFWGKSSAVNFGNIDIDVTDGGIDEINGEQVRWVEWAKNNLNPQVLISIEQDDRSLLHLATADCEDIFFPDDRTIRVSLTAKHQRQLDQFINDYVPQTSTYDEEVQGRPIPLTVGAGAASSPGYDYSTFEPRSHYKTILVDGTIPRYMVTFLDAEYNTGSPADYYVMDRGVVLREGESPGFTLWENGFDLTDNPDGEITFQWVADEGGGVLDPLETGELLQGPFRISRWAVDRAGIDVATYFPSESEFPDLYPVNMDETMLPALSYTAQVSARQVLDDAVVNLCGFWYVDEQGDFVFGKFEAPETVTPSFSYTDVQMIGDISSRVDRAPGLSDTMRYSFSPGAIDINNIAGSVTDQTRRDRLSREWLEMFTTSTIPDEYATARGNEPMKIYTGALFTDRVRDELDRRWDEYYSGIRRFYTWTIPLRGGDTLPDLGDIVSIQSDRAELLTFGELPVVLSEIKYDLGAGLITMTGWGGETAEPTVPDAPTNLVATAGDEEVDLAWDDNS